MRAPVGRIADVLIVPLVSRIEARDAPGEVDSFACPSASAVTFSLVSRSRSEHGGVFGSGALR